MNSQSDERYSRIAMYISVELQLIIAAYDENLTARYQLFNPYKNLSCFT